VIHYGTAFIEHAAVACGQTHLMFSGGILCLCVAFVLVLGTLKTAPPEAFFRRTHRSLTTNSDPQRSPTPGRWKSMQGDDPTVPERLFRQMAHPELLDPENPFAGN
jgi:hypothetical protein